MLEHAGYKIGLIGIAEFDWIATLAHFEIEELSFEDPTICSDRLGRQLRNSLIT